MQDRTNAIKFKGHKVEINKKNFNTRRMDMKTQFEKYPSPIKFESSDNGECYVSIRYKVDKAKDVFNNPNDIEFQTLKKCINEVTVTTGDWERLTGQERDCME